MKRLPILFMLAVLLSLNTVLAANPNSTEPKLAKAMVSQVYALLQENKIPDAIRGSMAEIRVAVDDGNYLRILSIETENEALEKFIRTSIDFEKLRKGSYEQGIVYRIPLEVRK